MRAFVATSRLELGIDMGAVDLVIQVESPGAVSRGLQRIGRAGHSVGEPSRGKIFPKHRGDLLEAAVVTRRMHDGEIESTRYLRNPLDVLAQQIVAHVAAGERSVEEVSALVRRSAGFAELSDELLVNVLDLLSGRYPSEEFAELRPRIVWDRVNAALRARDGSKRLAVTNGGHDPRSRAVRCVPARTARASASSTRRWSTRAARARRSCSAHRPGGSRTSPFERVTVTPGAGRAGQDAVLARRPARPPARARPGARRLPCARSARLRRGRRRRAAARPLRARRAGRPPTSCSYLARAGGRRPVSCPTTARSSSSVSATRSATGGCAC